MEGEACAEPRSFACTAVAHWSHEGGNLCASTQEPTPLRAPARRATTSMLVPRMAADAPPTPAARPHGAAHAPGVTHDVSGAHLTR